MSYGIMNIGEALRGPKRRQGPEIEPAVSAHYEDVDLAIVCEATYPYLTGGLSAVVHQICEANPDLRIGIIHITWDASSPLVDVYGVPPQVKWVMPVFQSMAEHAETFQKYTLRDLRMPRKAQRVLAERVFDAIRAHQAGDDALLWQLYDEGINPRTRSYVLWPVFTTLDFMTRATVTFGNEEWTFAELFWQLRDFVSLAFAATSWDFPRATIYHAHTTGAAALLSAAAARQNNTSFVLTEHNLYTRDTINHLLDRSMDNSVTLATWWQLTSFATGGSQPPAVRSVTPKQRAWMAWFTRLGVLSYRAADRITYLYPEAIDEAADLGGLPAKSRVVPNGIDPAPFAGARARFAERRARLARTGDPSTETEPWRLAYAARVVGIKGLTDLLESLAMLRERGVDRFLLDVMGPEEEQPEYVALCRARCTELGLDAHVRFLGRVDLDEHFDEYDMLVLPSHNEGVPIVILEAMAVGLPVLATHVGGIREVVVGTLPCDPVAVARSGRNELGACGHLVPPRDSAAMADAIEMLMRDPALYESFSTNAILRADHLFHIDVTSRQYRDLFAELGVALAGQGSTPVGSPPADAGSADAGPTVATPVGRSRSELSRSAPSWASAPARSERVDPAGSDPEGSGPASQVWPGRT